MRERAFLPVFETQCLSHAMIWRLARASDQQHLAIGFRTQDHLFAIRQLIVFNFSMNWRFVGKIYVNKNNRTFGKFILLLTCFGLLQQGKKNRYYILILAVGSGRSIRCLDNLQLGQN
jgi:hypothetical protein